MNMKTTPIGILSGFVALESPSTKFNDDGIYTCEMDFTGDAILTMKDQISIALKDSRIKYREGNVKEASPPYKIENDVLTVRFKQKAKIVSRSGKSYEKTITIYDAAAAFELQPDPARPGPERGEPDYQTLAP